MEVSRNRSWRPPANATTFSFGPWVTCHCAHGMVEEPEVRIHADEEVSTPPLKLRFDSDNIDKKMKASDFKKPPLQLPEAAIPEREDRKRDELSKVSRSPKRVQLPAAPPTWRQRLKKVVMALLLLFALCGLALLAGSYPLAERLSNELEEHSCKLSSPNFRPSGEIPYVHSPLGVSCWVQLSSKAGETWSPVPASLQHGGWTLITFDNPKEFLSPRSTCASQVQQHEGAFRCFFSSSSEGAKLGVLTQPMPSEVELLMVTRYPLTLLAWLVSWPVFFVLALQGKGTALKTAGLRCFRILLKVLAVLVVVIAVSGPVVLVTRHPETQALQKSLQDGTCQLRSSSTSEVGTWHLVPAAQCQITVAQDDLRAKSLVFAYPSRWFDLQYHQLKCDELVKSLSKSFPCAVGGQTAYVGEAKQWTSVFLELTTLQFEHPVALEMWCLSVIATLVMLPLVLCSRRSAPPEGYRRLAGDAR
ncbi:unnamed protein product [Durusdinium trenchii]|uniref:Uncharacterized protein n=1 Tax=Durusdinium trenchii TaxID=1381693 RepID=A0ABP0J8S3_9DINO